MANFIQRPRLPDIAGAYQRGALARNQFESGQISNRMNAFNLDQAQQNAPMNRQMKMVQFAQTVQNLSDSQRKATIEKMQPILNATRAYSQMPVEQQASDWPRFAQAMIERGADPAEMNQPYSPELFAEKLQDLEWVYGEVAKDHKITEYGAPGGRMQRGFVDPSRPNVPPIPIGDPYTNKPLVSIGSEIQPQAPGLPKPGRPPWSNIQDPKKRDDAKIRYGTAAQKKLDKMKEKVDSAALMSQQIERFLFLNQENYTGREMVIPGVSGMRSTFDAGFQEMMSISDKLTPAMRQGMPGAASDRDVAMFKSATVGIGKSKEANENIGKGMIVGNMNYAERQAFMEEYYSIYGHLNGAEKQWRIYLNANPIFDPSAQKGSYLLNEKRQKYQEFFAEMSETEDLYRKYGLER